MNGDAQQRVKLCLIVAALNFLILVFPEMKGVSFYTFLSLGVLLNVVAVWLILKGVRPLKDESEHLKSIALSKRWIAVVGGFLTIVALVASFSGVIGRQAILFLAFGYIFLLLVPMKILDLAVEKRIREVGNGR